MKKVDPNTTSIRVHISRTYEAEAAHQLPGLPAGHKCGQMHGHSYKITVYLNRGNNWQDLWETNYYPWILDFAAIDDILKPWIKKWIDHQLLNDYIECPTSENLAARLLYDFTNLINETYPDVVVHSVNVSETDRSSATAAWGQ